MTLGVYWRSNRALCIVVLLLFLERLAFLFFSGAGYSLHSDDNAYVRAGVHFANTGIISMHSEQPSAQSMPGMAVLIGLFSLIFGESTALWLALKLLWITLGSLTAFFAAKTVEHFAPPICGLFAACFFVLPNFVWMDNLILTETPYIFLFTLALWALLGMDKRKCCFPVFAAAVLLAFMFRANIILLPVFAVIYLLVTGYNKRRLLGQTALLAVLFALFVIPWSVRNDHHFHRFIPMTYGTGNAVLLGTYQGTGYPDDEALDAETHIDATFRERFAAYLDDSGQANSPVYAKMLELEKDGVRAQYRMAYWWQNAPRSMLYSYFVLKPVHMLASVFYWSPIFNVGKEVLVQLRTAELWLCLLALFSAFYCKEHRAVMATLSSYYLVNIAIYAYSFSFDRYAESLVPVRYILLGIGIPLILRVLAKACRNAMVRIPAPEGHS